MMGCRRFCNPTFFVGHGPVPCWLLGACAVGNRDTSERMRLASSVAVLWREGVPPSIAPARARILVVQRMFCAPCGAVEGGTPSLRELVRAR